MDNTIDNTIDNNEEEESEMEQELPDLSHLIPSDNEINNAMNRLQDEILNNSNFQNSIRNIFSTEWPDSSFNLNQITTNTLNNVLNSSLSDKPKYKYIISEKGLEEIKNENYSKLLQTNSFCPITQIEFVEGMKISQLPCSHCFNNEAIIKWVSEEKAECPVCRYKMDSIEVEDKQKENDMETLPTFQIRNFPLINLNPSNSILGSLFRSHQESLDSLNLLSIINTRIEEENEEDLQQAILNSMSDISNNPHNNN